MNLELREIRKDDCEVPLSSPLVTFSSTESQPSTSPSPSSNISAEDVSSLSDMFPLLTEAAVLSALCECGGNLSPALDLLLTRDLMEREKQDQVMIHNQTTPLCDLWIRGDCTGARAAACTARHFYLDSDIGDGCRGKNSGPDSVARMKGKRKRRRFSSPYRARLVTEQVTVEREEIDIESGMKESWIEVQERELVDLTGSEEMSGSGLENENVKKVDDNKEGINKKNNSNEGTQHSADPINTPDTSFTMLDEYLNRIVYDYMSEINKKLAKKFKKESNMTVELPSEAPDLREIVKYFTETSSK